MDDSMSKFTLFFCRSLALICLLVASSCSQKKVFVVHYPLMEEPYTPYTPPYASPISRTGEIKNPLIVIDAGHGGKDLGAEVSKKPVLKEKNLNLMTAKLLESYLRQMGFRTLMTRRDDAFVSLDKRASLANSSQSDLFVSVHYNSAPSNKAEGIEIYYFKNDNNKERVQKSKGLGELILKNIIKETDAKSRGVKHGNLAVVRKTTMPAVLVEGGFLTNEQELAKIRDPSYIKTLAWGIAQGIRDFLQNRT